MRFALVLAVTSAIALTDAAPVVQSEGAVPDVPHRDPADYYKVVAALPTETAEIPPHKKYKGVPQATEGITVQQAKRWLIFGDPTLNRTEPVRPQLPKTNVSTNRFHKAKLGLLPCFGFCEAFVEKNPSIWGVLLCPCVPTGKPSPTITEGHGPKETGKPSSTITEGHGPKVTEKASSTITKERGPKVTEMPTSTITLEQGPKVTKMPSSTKAHGHEETKMSQL
ncbi:hypothetical protein MGU_02374 [Metarhizium guizhouense ARSEF 977]|uniref:Uncharacterized protein n=1 Tax=Metarhizium guizhouense (strain ARSEF 977) TaxID=1276136 RepID=A0A0B4HE97_METGA|nr:hypothetical protein MGU_02374 [Metarhizium guizhouense ARSEF 977]